MTETSDDVENGVFLAGAPIVLPEKPEATERLAARELARYLYLLTGGRSPAILTGDHSAGS